MVAFLKTSFFEVFSYEWLQIAIFLLGIHLCIPQILRMRAMTFMLLIILLMLQGEMSSFAFVTVVKEAVLFLKAGVLLLLHTVLVVVEGVARSGGGGGRACGGLRRLSLWTIVVDRKSTRLNSSHWE